MTTYKQGYAPHGAPAVWYMLPFSTAVASVSLASGTNVDAHVDDAERICRAFHLAAMAEDYAKAKAARDAAPRDDDAVLLAYYDAARRLCEAVRG